MIRVPMIRSRQPTESIVLLTLMVGAIGFVPGASIPATAASSPRVPWTTSRVLGNPEAPLPYVAERAYTNLVFDNPTELDFLPDGSFGLVIERNAHVRAFENRPGVPRAELAADLNQGRDGRTEAYAIVFDPGFATNRHVFVSMTLRKDREALMKVSRFRMDRLAPPRLDLASELSIIEWPSGGHNGCDLHFGLDGYLYVSAGDGDGPAPPDPRRTGQDLDDLLSTIFRIDVRHARAEERYRVPPDNPFLNVEGARPEIWAYGFRNPWKTCIDPRDGALWIGDVGWENWELVFRVDEGGFNGGWSAVEGPQNVHPSWPQGPTPIQPPLQLHPHTEATSITGGRVYRGDRWPDLKNAFVYGDWGTGRLWALRYAQGTIQAQWELALTSQRIVGFAEDHHRELFYIDNAGGGIYRLVPNTAPPSEHEFPTRLSETGLLADTAHYRLAPGVYPFDIAAPMWSDHATVQRAVALPGTSSLVQAGDLFEVPTNAVFVRTLSLEMERGRPETSRRIETQILHFDGLNFNGYSYRWNEQQSDAELVDKDGLVVNLTIEDPSAPLGRRDQSWRFLSRSECVRCHISRYNSRFGNLTGLVPEQLSAPTTPSDLTELERLGELDLIIGARPVRSAPGLVNPYDETGAPERRARSWLHANCAHCHRRDGGGAVVMYLQNQLAVPDMNVVDEPATRGAFGLPGARRVAAGNPYHSTLLYRILTTSAGRMPVIGSTLVDDTGAQLVRDWIVGLAKDSSSTSDLDSLLKEWDGSALPPPASAWNSGPPGAMRLAMAAADPQLPAPLRRQLIQDGLSSHQPAARDLLERFLPADQRRQVLGASPSPQLILARTGDAAAGRDLFFSPTGPQCSTCHRLFGQGADFGPDLEHVGNKFGRAELLEHILRPASAMEPAWVAHAVETTDGESLTGFILQRTQAELRIKTAAENVAALPAASIKSVRRLETSLMPEGLLQSSTAQEAADLLDFLGTLK